MVTAEFDAFLEAVLIVDRSGRFIYFNQAFESLVECSGRKLRNAKIEDLFESSSVGPDEFPLQTGVEGKRVEVSLRPKWLSRDEFKSASVGYRHIGPWGDYDDCWLFCFSDSTLEHRLVAKYRSQLQDKEIAYRTLDSYRDGLEKFIFGLLFLITGFQFIAIQESVRSLPPLASTGGRYLISGLLLIGLFIMKWREELSISRLKVLIMPVALYRVVGLGGLAWSLQQIPSGISSIILGSSPIWIYITSLIAGKESFSRRIMWGLLLGLGGLSLIVGPSLVDDLKLGTSYIVLVACTIAYSVGLVLRPKDVPLSLFGFEQVLGGLALIGLAFIFEPIGSITSASFTVPTILALLYLTLFMSLVGETSLTWLMGSSGATKANSFVFIRPLVALFVGWLIAGETLGFIHVLGIFAVLISTIFFWGKKANSP